MAKFELREIIDKKIWETYLLSRKPGTFLQSWNWGETNALIGQRVKRFGVFDENKVIGIFQLIHQAAKRGNHYIIPGGPIIDYNNSDLLNFTFQALRRFLLSEKAWFVRIRPDVPDTEILRKKLRERGLLAAPMHLHGENTLVLDITKDEEVLLKEMRKTTRYLIKKSLTEGYSIRLSNDPNDVDLLYKLQKETAGRHKFVGFRKDLFEAQMKTFGKDKQAQLFVCEKNHKPLVAAIIIFYGEKAFYHHSGSANKARNTNASYFLQWQVIKYAKEQGYRYYDFWGIAPTSDPRHRFSGVTTFKTGFGGLKVDWLHAHDLPVSLLYWLNYIFETGRRMARRL